MSTSTRRTSQGGWDCEGNPPLGPNGRRLCRRCAYEVPRDRKTFCSKECVHEWKIRTNPGYVRDELAKRDKGVCAICATDTGARLDPWFRERARGAGHLWQADHIVPVIEGGGECGLDNYRTLCTDCHKRETAALRKRMAVRAREVAAQIDLQLDDRGRNTGVGAPPAPTRRQGGTNPQAEERIAR